MASGKSVVAEKLSQLLDFRFVDTDKWIEARCCKSISEIFFDHGENFFTHMIVYQFIDPLWKKLIKQNR